MVVPEDREGRDVNNSVLARGSDKSSDVMMMNIGIGKNCRNGGCGEVKVNPRVIVDMKEFRSELPSLLHKRGIDIEPVTLVVNLILPKLLQLVSTSLMSTMLKVLMCRSKTSSANCRELTPRTF